MTATAYHSFMINKRLYFTGLTFLLLLITSGFIRFNEEKIEGFHLLDDQGIKYGVASELTAKPKIYITAPEVTKSFSNFAKKMAYKESRGMLHLVNPFGYMGKYQFGKSTLRTVGIHDFQEFLCNSSLQDEAFKALVAINKWQLRKEIQRYSGKVINNVKITESGLIAAAHLAGAGSVKKYLHSNGRSGFKDGFGTSLSTYIKKFSNYDISSIEADANAKVAEK